MYGLPAMPATGSGTGCSWSRLKMCSSRYPPGKPVCGNTIRPPRHAHFISRPLLRLLSCSTMTAISPRHSTHSAGSSTIDLEAANGDSSVQGLKRRPWRRSVTPWQRIVSESYEGEGTEGKSFIVSWLSDDLENPQVSFRFPLMSLRTALMCV
jgi:hypothetical protein